MVGTFKIEDEVSNWCVSDQISLSDNRYVPFQVGDLEVTRVIYHDPKRTNWESSQGNLKASLGVLPKAIHLVQEVELAVDKLQQAILLSCHQAYPASLAKDSSLVEQKVVAP